MLRRPRWIGRGLILVATGALVLTPAAGALAAKSRVPVPTVALPPEVDWQAEYQGQVLCSPEAKPGAVKYGALLNSTYGKYITYIPRSCSTPGISEHEEGRAIDWMVNSENPVDNAKAWSFLNWVTAPGPKGEPGAMARRLGVMYLIWDDKMWRVYRPQDGWQEYSGCSAKQDDGYDTSCHRDHIHTSLTWDGAYGTTSFWTGKAELRGPCPSSATSRPNGTATEPKALINTDTGTGLAGHTCRLSAGTSYGSRSYTVKVPVPTTSDGSTPVQRLRLKEFDLESPEPLTIRSAKSVSVPRGTQPGTVIDVPLARDGVIRFSLAAGYAGFAADAVGTGSASATAPAPAPVTAKAKARLRGFSAPTFVNTPVVVTGKLKKAPAGSQLAIQRRRAGGSFATVGTSAVSSTQYAVSTPGVKRAGVYGYRTVLTQSGRTLSVSPERTLTVQAAVVGIAPIAGVAVRTRADIRGLQAGAPDGASLRLRVKAPKDRFRTIRERPFKGASAFTMHYRSRTAGTYEVRVAVRKGSHLIVRSAPQPLRIR